LTGDGKTDVLVIGASPASLEHGLNVWGSLDVRHCAKVLIDHAQKALQLVLPGVDQWQCRRMDVTANYALPDAASVKHALAQLLVTSGARRRPSSHNRGGDTVYWNPGSDLSKGKAYHKGPQVLNLWKKNKLDTLPANVELLDQVIRLEHTRGAKWFRRLEENGLCWQDLTNERLIELHTEFFTPLVGEGIEVKNMERVHIIQAIMAANYCTENQARAAFSTYRNIRQDGYETTKDSMSRATFFRHQKMLRLAGISDQHLRDAVVIPFPRVRFVLAKPVANWEDIRRAA
jgi:II/X family phage/plasmid replication protein